MSTASVRGAGPLSSIASLEGVDPQTVMLLARQERVNSLQQVLEQKVTRLETLIDKRQQLNLLGTTLDRFCAELDKVPEGGYCGNKMTELLRSDEWSKVSGLAESIAFDPVSKRFARPRIADAQKQSLAAVKSNAGVHISELDKEFDGLKSEVRELSATMDYEMKAMQRSLRSEANHKNTMVAS